MCARGRALRPSKTYASFVARLAAAPLVQASSVGETIYLRWVELIIGAPADGKVPYTFEYFAFRAVDRGGFERVAQHSQTFVFDPNDGQTRRVTSLEVMKAYDTPEVLARFQKKADQQDRERTEA